MYPTIRFFQYTIDTYDAVIIAGTLISLTITGFLMYQRNHKKGQSIANCGVLLLFVLLGGRVSQMVKSLDEMNFIDFWDFWDRVIVHPGGNHFIGRVLLIAVLLPVIYQLMLKILKRNHRTEKVRIMLDGAGVYIVIQHIFNRIACFCRGCCYGKSYSGFLSVSYKNTSVRYHVYPVQLFEIFGMCLLLILILLLLYKGKPVFGYAVTGFGAVIFICEFFMNQVGNTLIYGLSGIQYVAVLVMIIGVIHIVSESKSEKKQ